MRLFLVSHYLVDIRFPHHLIFVRKISGLSPGNAAKMYETLNCDICLEIKSEKRIFIWWETFLSSHTKKSGDPIFIKITLCMLFKVFMNPPLNKHCLWIQWSIFDKIIKCFSPIFSILMRIVKNTSQVIFPIRIVRAYAIIEIGISVYIRAPKSILISWKILTCSDQQK